MLLFSHTPTPPNYVEAEAVLRPTLAAQQRVLGPAHPTTLHTMHFLAWSLRQQRNFAVAATLYRSALEGRRRALGHEHAETRRSAAGLAATLHALGKHAEAEGLQ